MLLGGLLVKLKEDQRQKKATIIKFQKQHTFSLVKWNERRKSLKLDISFNTAILKPAYRHSRRHPNQLRTFLQGKRPSYR